MIPNIKMTYNGKNPEDFGICVTAVEIRKPARKNYPFDIPGRNGAHREMLRAWDNTTIDVSFAILGESSGDVIDQCDAMMAWLIEPDGYARLELSTDPDVYRMATVYEDFEVRDELAKTGEATVSFDCKPQRFLKAGERPLEKISSNAAPLSLTIAEGYGSEIFSSAFKSTIGYGLWKDRIMTVVDASSYYGDKLVLHYSDSRINMDEAALCGGSSSDPTTTSGTAVSFGDTLDLYDNVVELEIDDNYMMFETPAYYELFDENNELIGGLYPTTVTIVNPTAFPSKPLIKFHYSSDVEGPVCMVNGSPVSMEVYTYVVINGKSVATDDAYLDCETMDLYSPMAGYKRPMNWNHLAYTPSEITLEPGTNVIKLNNSVDYIEITPRWWRL